MQKAIRPSSSSLGSQLKVPCFGTQRGLQSFEDKKERGNKLAVGRKINRVGHQQNSRSPRRPSPNVQTTDYPNHTNLHKPPLQTPAHTCTSAHPQPNGTNFNTREEADGEADRAGEGFTRQERRTAIDEPKASGHGSKDLGQAELPEAGKMQTSLWRWPPPHPAEESS